MVQGAFAKYIIEHSDDWLAFSQERGLGLSREDIILVTGCHLTRTWATIALREREQVSFGVQVSGVSDVMWQFTREGARGVAYNLGPSDQVRFYILFLPQQTVTVHGRTFLIPRLRAAGGLPPSHPPDDDDTDPDMRLKSISKGPNETHVR